MENLTCILCPKGCSLTACIVRGEWEIKGNKCPKGREFALSEIKSPKRSICSTIKTSFKNVPRLPVRTNGEVPLKIIFDVIAEINSKLVVEPVHVGDIIIENVCNTGINVIATSDLYYLLEEEENEK